MWYRCPVCGQRTNKLTLSHAEQSGGVKCAGASCKAALMVAQSAEESAREQQAARVIQRGFRLTRAVRGTLLSERTGPPPKVGERRVFNPITSQRQVQLQGLDRNNYLAGLYGLRVVADMGAHEDEPQFLIGHQYSTSYLRDGYDKQWGSLLGRARSLMADVIKKLRDPQGKDPKVRDAVMACNYNGTKLCLVNSDKAAERLLFLTRAHGAENPQVLTEAPTIMRQWSRPGLFVLSYRLLQDDDHPHSPDHFLNYLKYVGATPSTYLMYKFLHAEPQSPMNALLDQDPQRLLSDDADNGELLENLLGSTDFKKLVRLASKPGPMRYIYDASARLLKGLDAPTISFQRKFAKGVLVKSSLEALANIVQAMAFYDKHVQRCRRLYDLLLDELFLILAVVKPYKPGELMTREEAIQDKRSPVLRELFRKDLFTGGPVGTLRRVIYPAWSGMDSLVTALEAAIEQSGNEIQLAGEGEQATYFEMGCALAAQGRISTISLREEAAPNAAILMATMNPSTPEIVGPTPLQIASLVIARHRRAPERVITLIVDVTIQTSPELDDTHRIDELVERLRELLANGNVQLILARSYQKYGALGSGKFMGGCTTLIHAQALIRSAAYLRGRDSSAVQRLDEVQFFTHLLKYADNDELGMVSVASRNAEFIERIMPRVPNQARNHQLVRGSPFLLKSIFLKHWIERLGVAEYDSFGFAVSSYLDASVGVRINPGQEGRGTLLERFFAAGHLWDPTPAPGSRDAQPRYYNELPFRNVVSHLHSILVEANARYAGPSAAQSRRAVLEMIPFSPIDPPDNYAAPAPEFLTSYYREREKDAKGGTDLDHVLASYLTLAFRFSQAGMRWESPKSGLKMVAKPLVPLIQMTAEDRVYLAAFYRCLFNKGLLQCVTPEMRAELSAQWLMLHVRFASRQEALAFMLQGTNLKFSLELVEQRGGELQRHGAYAPIHIRKALLEEIEQLKARRPKSTSADDETNTLVDAVESFIRETSPMLGKEGVPTLLAASSSLVAAPLGAPWQPSASDEVPSAPRKPAKQKTAKELEDEARVEQRAREAAARRAGAQPAYARYLERSFRVTDNPGRGNCLYYCFDDGMHQRSQAAADRLGHVERTRRANLLRVAAAAQTAALIRLGVGVDPVAFQNALMTPQLGADLDAASETIARLETEAWNALLATHPTDRRDDAYMLLHGREKEAYVIQAVQRDEALRARLDRLARAYEAGQSREGREAGDLDFRGLVLATRVNLRMHYVDSSGRDPDGHSMVEYRYEDLAAQYLGQVVAVDHTRPTVDVLHKRDNHYVYGRPRRLIEPVLGHAFL